MARQNWQACACPECVEACRQRVGWPTPDEARRLIELGYGDRLMEDYWMGDGYNGGDINILAPANVGFEGHRAGFWPDGICTFLTDEGLCEIHDSGAKPMECRLTLCGGRMPDGVHEQAAAAWNNPADQEFVARWRRGEER